MLPDTMQARIDAALMFYEAGELGDRERNLVFQVFYAAEVQMVIRYILSVKGEPLTRTVNRVRYEKGSISVIASNHPDMRGYNLYMKDQVFFVGSDTEAVRQGILQEPNVLCHVPILWQECGLTLSDVRDLLADRYEPALLPSIIKAVVEELYDNEC